MKIKKYQPYKPSTKSPIIKKDTGKGLSKVTLKNRVGKAVRGIIDYGFSGKINNPDYSEWQRNIRVGQPEENAKLGSFKKGGKVKKTGLYKLHKGERVLTKKQAKKTKKRK